MLERVLEKREEKSEALCEKRRAYRVAMKVPVIIYSTSDALTSLYFSENVSKDGLYMLCSKEAFLVDEKVYIEFSVPLQIVSRRIRVIGKVVRRGEGDKAGYGIKFEKIFESDYSFLNSYLGSLKSTN